MSSPFVTSWISSRGGERGAQLGTYTQTPFNGVHVPLLSGGGHCVTHVPW